MRNLNAFATRSGVFRSPSRSGSSPSSASNFRIASCIFLFYISISTLTGIAQTADDLYADRANLTTIAPNRPEGHFWIAANMGALAESFGLRQGLRYRKPINEELETVLRLDVGFQSGSADRALGRWYFEVPGLFGGSNKRAEEHLRASLKYDEHSTVSHFFLAEVLIDEGRIEEARAELQKGLDAPLGPHWARRKTRSTRPKARSRLVTLR